MSVRTSLLTDAPFRSAALPGTAPKRMQRRDMSDEKRTLPLSRATAESLLNQRILMLDPAPTMRSAASCARNWSCCPPTIRPPTSHCGSILPVVPVPAMLAIADTMDLIPNDVATVNLGMAYSAGRQFLLCCGAAGKRYALPHAKVLLHQGSGGMAATPRHRIAGRRSAASATPS